MTGFFNTSLSQQQFLQEYWQKKPLLIRQAFPGFQSPISPEELAGLACEPEIESRLIEQYGENDSAWQVTAGPLSESDFDRLPETHWTMLVQDVDKHLPELQTLLDPLRFIPDWRRDDLMISYATESGSVGPHTDAYDVFLLQAMVTRRVRAIFNRLILQRAFSTLITYRAIQRVIDEQEFHCALLGTSGQLGLSLYHHAFIHRRCAGRQWLGCIFNLYQTHTAIGCDGQFGMIAKTRDMNPRLIRHFYQHLPRLRFELFAVYFNAYCTHDAEAAFDLKPGILASNSCR